MKIKSKDVAATAEGSFGEVDWGHLASLLSREALVMVPPSEAVPSVDEDSEKKHRVASGMALLTHWQSLGFVVSKDDALSICDMATPAHAWLHENITPALLRSLGGHRRMRPMYPNFPKQVMKMSESELYYNALMHYTGALFNLRVMPETTEETRRALPKKDKKQRVLELATPDKVLDFLHRVVSMNTVWDEGKRNLATTALPLLVKFGVVNKNSTVPQKENAAYLASQWLKNVGDGTFSNVEWPFKTASLTDVLRAVVVYNGDDATLPIHGQKEKMKSMPRRLRRVCLSLINDLYKANPGALGDTATRRESWLRFGEMLHPGEHKKSYPEAYRAFACIRSKDYPQTWHSKLDELLGKRPNKVKTQAVCGLIKSNPGYGARAINRMLTWANTGGASSRSGPRVNAILETFIENSDRVATPLLYTLSSFAAAQAKNASRTRVVFPKGDVRKKDTIEGSVSKGSPKIAKEAFQRLHSACIDCVAKRAASQPAMGKVFVQKGVEGVMMPKSLRTASEGAGSLSRGSVLPVADNAKIVRMFLWWHDAEEGRSTDIDLSAVAYDENFNTVGCCNYQGLKGDGMVHSGDLTSAPRGAAEFIDIDMKKVGKKARYVSLVANVYSGPNFKNLPECFVGWQERSKMQSGPISSVATTANKFEVNSPGNGFMASLFDVKERTVMWVDAPIRLMSGFSILDQANEMPELMRDLGLYLESQPKMKDVLDVQIAARGGTLVKSRKEADLIVSLAKETVKSGQRNIVVSQPAEIATEFMSDGIYASRETILAMSDKKGAQALLSEQENELKSVGKIASQKKKVKARR